MTRFIARLTLAVTVTLSLLEIAACAAQTRAQARVTIHAASSVKLGEGLLLECRVNHTFSLVNRLMWAVDSVPGFLCVYRFRDDAETAKTPRSCLDDRAWNWWAGNSNYVYINSTQLSDTENYTCSVKIKKFSTTVVKKQVVVYVKPKRVNITGLETGWVVADHKKVNVTCLVDQVYPVPEILWVIKDQPKYRSTVFTNQLYDSTFQVESRLKLVISRQPDVLRVKCLVVNPTNASDVWSSTTTQALVYYRPTVVVEPLESGAPQEGSTLTLVCRVKDAKPPDISRYVWKKNLRKLTVTSDQDRLVLTSLNASRDDGNYTCRAKNEAGNSPPMAALYVLKVHYVPVLQLQIPAQAQEGQLVKFNCVLIGAEPSPYSLVNWKKDGVKFNSTFFSKPLVIQNVKASDAGDYSCTRENSVGLGESPAVAFHVDYAPRGQAVISVPYGTVIVAGAPVRLQCDPPEDKGHPVVTWYEWTVLGVDTSRVNTSTNKWEVQTHSVTQSANYSCRVGNKVGASDPARWLEVTVEAPVHIEEPYQEVVVVATRSGLHINCTASGSNIRDIWWRRENRTLSLHHFKEKRSTVRGRGFSYGQTEATVSSLAWSNHSATCDQLDELSGSYTCAVLGHAGPVKNQDESADIVVDLQYAAVWNDVTTQQVTAAPGDTDKVLTCDICANPPPGYLWTFKGGALPEGVVSDAHTLTIPVVSLQNFGHYECVVINRVAGQQQSVMFTVSFIERGPPHIPEGVVVLPSATSRSLRVQWRPGYHGGFPPQWFIMQYKAEGDDHFITFNDSLPANDSVTVTLIRLQPHTKYTLQLFARNSRPGGSTESNHSRSGYVILSTVTRPRPSIEVRHVTVTADHMTVEWLYDGPARQRRSVTEPGPVSIVVHYKKQDGVELTYPLDAPASTLPASDRQARINGTFDMSTPYVVWLTVYEAQLLSHTTESFKQLPSVSGAVGVWGVVGAVLAGVLLMLLVLFVVVIWRCRRSQQKDGDVELMPSSSTGSPTGYSKVPQSAPQKTNGTNDPTGEEKMKKPPRRKKAVERALLAPEQPDMSTEDDVKKVKPPRMRKRKPQTTESSQPTEPAEPVYQNSPLLRRPAPEPDHQEDPLYDNVAPSVSGQPEPLYANVDTTDQTPSQPVEEEGMIYADLAFGSPRSSQPIVVHQADDSVEYTTIDFTKKATLT